MRSGHDQPESAVTFAGIRNILLSKVALGGFLVPWIT
jgi:hypothetical protein